MTLLSQRTVVSSAMIAAIAAMIYFAHARPGFFSNESYISEALLLQLIAVCLWHYEKVFFALLTAMFVWAGTSFPHGTASTSARWLVLAVAALAGLLRWMKCRHQHFQIFDLVALICAATALVSVLVSTLPQMALLKALSLFLLFLYGATGARLAVLGREGDFVNGLVICCELSVYLTLIFYFGFRNEFFGNKNSLGAFMGVLIAPVLAWASSVAGPGFVRRRRILALFLCWALIYISLSRAAIVAAAFSSAIFCLVSRRRSLLVSIGLVLLLLFAAAQILVPEGSEALVSTVQSSVLYKGRGEREGLFGSRLTPWQKTMAAIGQHPWFGTGFGTSDVGAEGKSLSVSSVETNEETGREHGSSYLALLEWVGLLGILPFMLLFAILLHRIAMTFSWLYKSGEASHCAIPLALVLTAGLVHGFFEDWIVAVGYYLTVMFWSFAFILVCIGPRRLAKQVQNARPWAAGLAAVSRAVTIQR